MEVNQSKLTLAGY